jgi:hypothetical protein
MRPPVFIESSQHTKKLLHIKLMQCSHCGKVGMLIFHGYIYGLSDYRTPVMKGRRIFCSNRNRRSGCGQTLTVYFCEYIKQRFISAELLWHFLQNILSGLSIEKAYEQIDPSCPLSLATFHRLWQRFKSMTSHIRTFLTDTYPHIALSENCPYRETIRHISLAYFNANCNPIVLYQLASQKAFI